MKKKESLGLFNNKYFITSCIIIALIGGYFASTFTSPDVFYSYDDVYSERKVSNDWACMDGCYHMLIVEYGNISVYNETFNPLLDDCFSWCHDNYSKVGEKE